MLREKSNIIVIVPTFEWGEDGSIADENWFETLQEVVQNGGAKSEWVGLTKSVTLSSAVLGTTTHLIRCIGVNQDGTNTVTFQTKNCLSTTTTFGSAATWSNSTARTQCTNYYNAFPGKDYIKTVSKGTNTEMDTESVVYTDETVWIPSIDELGIKFRYYHDRPPEAEYTNGCSAAYSYYDNPDYYGSTDIRKKNQSDSSSAPAWWWTRTRNSFSTRYVDVIYTNGYVDNLECNNAGGGLAPAFVIG